jgi:ABC-type Fe3+/spermidine/putrescine transport system ATPase subunit
MLELIDLHKSYEGKPLLKGISFSVARGETVCLLGASGSGKSTLLRLVAGLEMPEAGLVRWDGQDQARLPAHRRNFGLVFQDYALFPHLDVTGNVAFGLKMQSIAREEVNRRVSEALEQVNLAGFGARRVTDLSGGEQQRVALARALASGPRLLMFDEPLGALDRALREDLLAEIRRILHATGVPAIYVTHDQEEAYAIADRILLLHEGGIVQQGSPADVYAHPASVWVARFLGAGNILPGVMRSGKVRTALGEFEPACGHAHREGESVHLLVSAHKARLDSGGQIGGRVVDVIFRQDGFKVLLDIGLTFHLPEAPAVGAAVRLFLPPEALACLPVA